MLRKICKADGCETEFAVIPSGVTHREYCSDRCRYRENKRLAVAKRKADGNCPQCGGAWIEPEEKHKEKPEHCLKCQTYYSERYRQSVK